MPTYEYRCESCQKTHEAFQKMTDPPLEKCPACGGKLKRLIGKGAGIIFKGSGFYATDYRTEAYRKKQCEECKSPDGTCPVSGTPPKKNPSKSEP
ncbi:MAG: FmdB family zinc ribbon protein [Candidatus Omnitrophota bacterium]